MPLVDPDALAVVDGEQRLTHGELRRQAAALAHLLRSLGASPGERVAVMVPNSAAYLVAGTACSYARVAFIPVNWHLKSEELGWVLSDSEARVLVADPDLMAHVGPAMEHAPGCRLVTTDELPEGPAEPPDGSWATPQWMFYTSGTTGRPKGVVHAFGGPEAMERAQQGLCALWGITDRDVYLLSGPGYHAGPGGYAFTTLYAGGAVVVLRSWDAKEWFRLVDRHHGTFTFLTPAHLIRLLEVPAAERDRYDRSSLRLVIHGGAPCPASVKHDALDLLAPAEVSELYGASEGGITRVTADEWRARPGTVGRPWPGVEVRVLDEAGTPLPVGVDGLVYVRPAGSARFGYHRDEEKTAAAWRDDAFTVGDVGHLDQDGYLYLTDRASDMVLWGGVNIYPREVEEVLHRHPAVVDCAVVGVPDERYGEQLAAVVELRAPATAQELQEHVRSVLADFKVPRRVVVVDTVPRDPNGKVRKRLLRERLAGVRPTSGEPSRVVT